MAIMSPWSGKDMSSVETDFLSDIEYRKKLASELRQRLQNMPQNAQGMDGVNLKPLIAFSDSLNKTNIAASYEAPKDRNVEARNKLQDLINKSEEGIADDQLKYLDAIRKNAESDDRLALKQAFLDIYKNKVDKSGSYTPEERRDDSMRKDFGKSDDAKILKANADFQNKLEKYKDLVTQYGYQPAGSGAKALETAYSELGLSYKEAQNLGALTGPDWSIVQSAISPMTGLRGAVDSATLGGKDSIISSLDQIKANAEDSANVRKASASTIYGPQLVETFYQATRKAGKVGMPKTQTTGQKQKNTIVVSNGTETLEIDPKDLAGAQAEGFQEVK